jgi:hypothetical protein
LSGSQPSWHIADAVPFISPCVSVYGGVIDVVFNRRSERVYSDAEFIHASANPDNQAIASFAVTESSIHYV